MTQCNDQTDSKPASEQVVSEASESNREIIETLRDIEAFFRKEAAYECENMGAGGSAIALGRWKRYYMTIANVTQDLPELIAAQPNARRYKWLRNEETSTEPHLFPFWLEFMVKLTRETRMDSLIDEWMAKDAALRPTGEKT